MHVRCCCCWHFYLPVGSINSYAWECVCAFFISCKKDARFIHVWYIYLSCFFFLSWHWIHTTLDMRFTFILEPSWKSIFFLSGPSWFCLKQWIPFIVCFLFSNATKKAFLKQNCSAILCTYFSVYVCVCVRSFSISDVFNVFLFVNRFRHFALRRFWLCRSGLNSDQLQFT